MDLPHASCTSPQMVPNVPSFLIDQLSDEVSKNAALSQMRSNVTGAACLRDIVGVSDDHFA